MQAKKRKKGKCIRRRTGPSGKERKRQFGRPAQQGIIDGQQRRLWKEIPSGAGMLRRTSRGAGIGTPPKQEARTAIRRGRSRVVKEGPKGDLLLVQEAATAGNTK